MLALHRPFAALLLLAPGGALAQGPPGDGDVVISELLSDPEAGPEWIEVRNASGGDLQLEGCRLWKPGVGSQHIIRGSLVIGAGEELLLAKDAMPDGCPAADYVYGAVALKNGGDTLNLSCPPDAEGAPVASLIYGLDADPPRKGRSWFLCAEDRGAAEYREATEAACDGVTGSPGGPNEACPEPPPYPAPGEVRIMEVAVRSSAGPQPEWLELQGMADGERNLDGCALVDTNREGADQKRGELRERLSIGAGGRIVFTRGGDFPEDCDVGTVLGLPALDLVISYAETVRLDCPSADGGVAVIDSFSYHWSQDEAGERGALQRDPDALDVICPAPGAFATCAETTEGTPGARNAACPEPPPPPKWPGVGALVVTEIMISPEAEKVEWFEVFNPDAAADGAVDLVGCRVSEEGPVAPPEDDEDAEPRCVPDKACTRHEHDLALQEGLPIQVPAGGYLVLAKSSCDTIEGRPCAVYRSLTFNDSGSENLWITCPAAEGEDPSVRVDLVTYDLKARALFKGETQALRPELVKADGSMANNADDAWCASKGGTPAAPNNCEGGSSGSKGPGTGTTTPIGGGCECGTPGAASVPSRAAPWLQALLGRR